ncbi:unnamed protein product, partial [Amoebophrya sp. A120]
KQIRPKQVQVALQLILKNGTVSQLNMGEGKTSMIIPMLILYWRSRKTIGYKKRLGGSEDEVVFLDAEMKRDADRAGGSSDEHQDEHATYTYGPTLAFQPEPSGASAQNGNPPDGAFELVSQPIRSPTERTHLIRVFLLPSLIQDNFKQFHKLLWQSVFKVPICTLPFRREHLRFFSAAEGTK